jgi:hypothetical protein
MRDLSSNSHRIPTLRRIMGFMGIAVKVLIGLVLLLPMTAYVVGSLVAAADPPRQHDPIIVQEPAKTSDHPRQSPSAKPTEKPGHHKGDDKHGRGNDDNETPEVITPSPSELFDDHGGLDNSGKGSDGGGDDGGSSGKGSGDD